MPKRSGTDIYASCWGLSPDELRELLEYRPDTGMLRWRSRAGRGGARRSEVIVGDTFQLYGVRRNSLGVVYMVHVGHLPDGRVVFRDGRGSNWRWENIKPLTFGEIEPPPPFTEHRVKRRGKRNAQGAGLKR